jgi:hypothetical protein
MESKILKLTQFFSTLEIEGLKMKMWRSDNHALFYYGYIVGFVLD